jgi:hypothetical protein
MKSTIPARSAMIALALVATSLAISPLAGAHAQGPPPRHDVALPQIPASVRIEHEGIQRELAFATRERGAVGAAARDLAKLLRPHFEREEQIALPPLGLVAALARGDDSQAMRAVLPMTDSLRAELPHMLAEHVAIRAATQRLERVAGGSGNARAVRLARELALHARNEEELLYPMAVLVGHLVRMRTTTASR